MTAAVYTMDVDPLAIAALRPDAEVRALLAACDLPSDDLDSPAVGLELYGSRDADNRVVATVGLEAAGRHVLLRSLAATAVADWPRGCSRSPRNGRRHRGSSASIC